MAKTIIVAGFGPGVSTAVAERFGREGFSVALVAATVGAKFWDIYQARAETSVTI